MKRRVLDLLFIGGLIAAFAIQSKALATLSNWATGDFEESTSESITKSLRDGALWLALLVADWVIVGAIGMHMVRPKKAEPLESTMEDEEKEKEEEPAHIRGGWMGMDY